MELRQRSGDDHARCRPLATSIVVEGPHLALAFNTNNLGPRENIDAVQPMRNGSRAVVQQQAFLAAFHPTVGHGFVHPCIQP